SHRHLILLVVTHLRESGWMALRLKHAVPLEVSRTSWHQHDAASDLAVKLKDLTAVAVCDPRSGCCLPLALGVPEHLGELLSLDRAPHYLCEATRQAVDALQVQASVLNEKRSANLLVGVQ